MSKHNQEHSGATVENGPPAVRPENRWLTDFIFLSHGQRQIEKLRVLFKMLEILELKFKDETPHVGGSY